MPTPSVGDISGSSNSMLSEENIRYSFDHENSKKFFFVKRCNQQLLAAATREHPNTVGCLNSSWTSMLYDADGNQFNHADFEGNLFNAITTLGRWKLKGDVKDFLGKFVLQPVLLVEDHYETRYIWGPCLDGGNRLYLVSPALVKTLKEINLHPWIRKIVQVKDRVTKQLVAVHDHRFTRRYYLKFSINVAAFVLAPPVPYMITVFSTNSYIMWAVGQDVIGQLPTRYRICRAINTVARINWEIQGAPFKVVHKVSTRLRKGMARSLLAILEMIGVDVSEYWKEIVVAENWWLDETISILLCTSLVYIVYRAISYSLGVKTEGEYDKSDRHTKSSKKAMKTNQTRQLRRFNHQSSKDLKVCESICKEEDDYEYEGEDGNYLRVGTCKVDKDNFYKSKILDEVVNLTYEFEGAIQVEVRSEDRTHITFKVNSIDDFVVEQHKLDEVSRYRYKSNDKDNFGIFFQMSLVGNQDDIKKQYLAIVKEYEQFHIYEFYADFLIRRVEGDLMCRAKFFTRTTITEGQRKYFTRANLKGLEAVRDRITGKKIVDTSVNKVLNEFRTEGISDVINYLPSFKKNHMVRLVKHNNFNFESTEERSSWGIGHRGVIFLNAHFCKVGEYLRFSRKESDHRWYGICKVIDLNNVRDLAIAKIMTKSDVQKELSNIGVSATISHMMPVKDLFSDVSSVLCSNQEWVAKVDDVEVLTFLPKSDITIFGRAKARMLANVCSEEGIFDCDTKEIFEIRGLSVETRVSQPGDCGGPIFLSRISTPPKLIGFHTGSSRKYIYGAFLVKEDLASFRYESEDVDEWEKLIVKGQPTDLPSGSCCEFIGKYVESSRPAGKMDLSHWHKSPFANEFEEQLQPGPLSAKDPRIEIELPKNLDGEKSLLLGPNGAMCGELPRMDKDILQSIVEQYTIEYTCKISHIHKVPSDLNEAIEQGLNGHPEAIYTKGMELNKAAGLPWSNFSERHKKSDYLDNDDGKISFKKDEAGVILERRVKHKLSKANQGRRLISLSNSKLKDAQIKIDAVKKGKTRVFHCIPVDKIICDATLFGPFKEAYTESFLNLNHAVGVDPHSYSWSRIYEKITTHPNYFDLDYQNYDKFLHQDVMNAVFSIIINVIDNKTKDEWRNARHVLANESINTYVVDYDTIYRTERGNKSGEYLTTVVNCIANDIYSFYCWIKTTGELS